MTNNDASNIRIKRSTDNLHFLPLSVTDSNLVNRPLSAFQRRRLRELSRIREASHSSSEGTIRHKRTMNSIGQEENKPAPSYPNQRREAHKNSINEDQPAQEQRFTPISSRVASNISLPSVSIPERRSSASVFRNVQATSRQSSMHDLPSWRLEPQFAAARIVPRRGQATSPVRLSMQQHAVSSDALRRMASKTLIRTIPPLDILDCPSSKHSRFEMMLHLPSSVFVGGGTAEGSVKLFVDRTANGRSKGLMYITRLSLDLVGVEEVSDGRRWIFLSLASELFDEEHPPPPSLVSTQTSVSSAQTKWPLKPSIAVIPFSLNLPLNLGPPPYLSKQARIRYIVCPTATIQVGDKTSIVRQSWNVQMLTVYDPEKALASLPSPLLASETLSFSSGTGVHSIKLTAGLHRQTWVNGSRIFVDTHIVNNSLKVVKKVEVQLEKKTLWYAHAAAGTAEQSASHLRLPQKSDTEVISTVTLKKGKGFDGVGENDAEVRTMDLQVPRDHVTISTGRYFEIRYFVNVIAHVSLFKRIAIQMPVTIIHMNSLDIVPNSLAQVAAAIEAKRAKTVPMKDDAAIYLPYHQGQVFSAPRRQFLDNAKLDIPFGGDLGDEELTQLQREVDESPRRTSLQKPRSDSNLRNRTGSTQMDGHEDKLSGKSHRSSHHHHSHHPSCYHCQIVDDEHHVHDSIIPMTGPKIPRLQLSTSGLGFTESEFEIGPDSPPRKVMLSERERRMIHQQRELRLARQRSIARNRATSDTILRSPIVQNVSQGRSGSTRHPHTRMRSRTVPSGGRNSNIRAPATSAMPAGRQLLPGDSAYWGWRNVAAIPRPSSVSTRYSATALDRDVGRRASTGSRRVAVPVGASYIEVGGRRSLNRTGGGLVDGVGGTDWAQGRR